MAIYTLSMNFIDGVRDNHSHLHNVFLKFPNPDCEHKAAMDKSRRLLNLYATASKNNVDLLKWLEWMSHGTYFAIIDVTIPEEISEEETYLMVAASTKAYKKIIVGSHQCWQHYDYLDGSNKILYAGKEITILDKDEAYAELNDSKQTINNINITNNDMPKKNNPWISGLFYLFLAIIIVTGLTVATKYVHWAVLPLIIIGAILIICIVGALQLRNDDKIEDKSFLNLIIETYKQLPLLNRKNVKSTDRKKTNDKNIYK